MKPIFIYVLSDPRTNHVRYVGQTDNLKERFSNHIARSKKGKTYRDCWIKSLLTVGLLPAMDVIEEIQSGERLEADEIERFWIASLRFLGCELCNLDSGGNSRKQLSEASIQKMREARRGRVITDETKEKLRNAWKRIPEPVKADIRRRISLAIRGLKPRTQQHIDNNIAKRIGRPYSEDHCRKIGVRSANRSPDVLAKIGASRRLAWIEQSKNLIGPKIRKRQREILLKRYERLQRELLNEKHTSGSRQEIKVV